MKKLFQEYKKFKALVFFGQIAVKRKIREILKRKTFYVIGDSHVQCFQHELFRIHHIGPSTAYKLGFEKSTTKGREKVIKILNKIYNSRVLNVIFVFGELDARIHINKAANEKKISLNKAIEDTINSYMKFLTFIKRKYPLIDIYVFNILPQGEEKNVYNFPYYASKKLRTIIAEKFNEKLKIKCKKNKLKFINIYDNLINNKKNRKKEYVYDEVHFNRKIIPFVINELRKFS